MKTYKRILSVCLLIVMVVSALSVTAYAANTGNTSFYNFTMETSRRYLNPRAKENYSPSYVIVTEADNPTRIYVAAHGSYSQLPEDIAANCTWDANGTNAIWVTIMPRQHYLIRSCVWENGYRYASLGFSVHMSYPNEISGAWSPDSSEAAQQNYPYAYYYA